MDLKVDESARESVDKLESGYFSSIKDSKTKITIISEDMEGCSVRKLEGGTQTVKHLYDSVMLNHIIDEKI